MSSTLMSPNFWSEIATSYNTLKSDGSLKYIVLDQRYKMQPLVRKSRTTFTQFLLSDSSAKACKVIVNGNYYGVSFLGKLAVLVGTPDPPESTSIQGMIVENGTVTAGDSRPDSFWFGQVMAPWAQNPWTYMAGKGDPPIAPSTLAAVGGAGPMIVSGLPFGAGNLYKPGAPKGTVEPPTGQPPPPAQPYMIQRNNATFVDVNSRPPQTGKTILAYCSPKRALLVAVQQDGAAPGETHAAITEALAKQGFDAAVFLDGSDSATLVVDNAVVVAPGNRKNETIDVGIGFRL